MHKKEFLERVQAATGIAEADKVEKVTTVVLNSLRNRITKDEADDVSAQLPDDLKDMWGGGIKAFLTSMMGPSKLDEAEFLDRVARNADLDPKMAEQSVRAVFHTLKDQISQGESADVAAQLPKKLKVLWLES